MVRQSAKGGGFHATSFKSPERDNGGLPQEELPKEFPDLNKLSVGGTPVEAPGVHQSPMHHYPNATYTQRGNLRNAVAPKSGCGGPEFPSPQSPVPSPQSPVPSTQILFSIEDTGIGIPPEKMKRLFQPFTQADASMTRQYGGTGLGLVISKRLGDMMGGSLWVESQGCVGGNPALGWQSEKLVSSTHSSPGSTFYFTITVPVVANPESGESDTCSVQLAAKRLLIVDNNPTTRKILSLQAEFRQMQVLAAQSSEEALALLSKEKQFDIAIVDMQMPQMHDFTLAREIHKLPGYQNLPLVILTSLGKPENKSDFGDIEFITCLSKPIKQSQFYNVLAQALGNQPLPTTVSRPHPPETGSFVVEQLPLRILLAEDTAMNQKVALLMLRKIGYQADVAANGLEVLQALQRQPVRRSINGCQHA